MARFKRLSGDKVFFLSGTDEHGLKIKKSAEKAGMEPLEFTNQVSQRFRDLLTALNCSNDDFIRTTEVRHKKACQALWDKLVANGDIYLGKYSGWYAVRDEAYYAEDELTKTAGSKMIAPSGAECEWVEEESYFFKLSAWGDRLLDFYEKNPDFIKPVTRRNEIVQFVKSGLHDLSVSRTAISWGIPVPNESRHVMYVWLDALTNYISALGYPDIESEKFKDFWPSAVHVMGKDIIRFHAVYWPAFLMAAGVAPPKKVFAHGWWTNEGQKISKSLGNVIDPYELIADYGLDQMRYFLLREVPFGNDGDFSKDSMIRRMNSDLANGIGNLAQRTLSLIAKNCEGKVPAHSDFSEQDNKLLHAAYALPAMFSEHMNSFAFNKALDSIWELISAADRYIDSEAPWSLKKTDITRMQTVLFVLAEVIRIISLLLQPFMPTSADALLNQLSVPSDKRSLEHASGKHVLTAGTPLPAPTGVFPRFNPPK